MDPVALRRKNLVPDDAYPYTSAAGLKFEKLSHHAATDKIVALMDYEALRTEQAQLREQGIYRGIGLASFIEVTNPSAAFYGVGGAKISSQDGVTMQLDAQGAVICRTGVSEQGQGTEAVIAQVAASAFGVPIERVRVVMGDTDNTPYGGGTWASRAAGIGGEAAWQAGKALRATVLAAAGSILQAVPETLDIRDGMVVDADSGIERLSLEEVARIVYFRPDTLPPGFQAEFVATRHYVPRAWPFAFTNGVQAAMSRSISTAASCASSSTGAYAGTCPHATWTRAAPCRARRAPSLTMSARLLELARQMLCRRPAKCAHRLRQQPLRPRAGWRHSAGDFLQ